MRMAGTRPLETARCGFTLAELMVATALASFVMAGLYGFVTMVAKYSLSVSEETALGTQATLAQEAIRGAMRAATFIAEPSPGSSSVSRAVVWANVMPGDASAPLVSGLEREFHLLCSNGKGSVILYEGSGDLPVIDCGAAAPSGTTRSYLAGAPGTNVFGGSAVFSRPPGEGNVLDVSFFLEYSKPGAPRPRRSPLQRMRFAIDGPRL